MWFLWGFLVFAFVLLAVRTEINSRDIRLGLWETCQAQAERAQAVNPGRVALSELLLRLVDKDPEMTVPEREAARQILRGGLEVPPINCGLRP